MINFREYVTASGLRVFGGKDAENNDKLIWDAGMKDILLHTSEPGSPFVNIGENPHGQDIKEAAIFCAKYSQDWRRGKNDVIVGKFLRSDMNKSLKMKSGSWKVKKQESIKVKRSDIMKFEKELRSKEVGLRE